MTDLAQQTDLAQRWRERLGDAQRFNVRSLDDLPGLAAAFELHDSIGVSLQPESCLRPRDDTGFCGQVDLTWMLGEEEVGTASLDIDTVERSASLEGMRLIAELQSLGFGRRVVRQLVDLSTALGLDELRTLASQIGRYAWARCGFDFAGDEERETAVIAAADVAGRLGRPFDGASVQHSWELAEMAGEDIPLVDAAEMFGSGTSPKHQDSITYGMALLLGPKSNDWAGSLSLADGCPCLAQLARD